MSLLSARKTLLFFHVTTSMGLLGGVVSFLALSIAGLAGRTDLYGATDIIADVVVLPLTILALALGILQSLVSPWGLFRHHWVVVKLITTVIVLGVLLLQMGGIDRLAGLTGADINEQSAMAIRSSLVLHSAAGIVPLLLATILSIFKPKGLSRYGWERRIKAST